MSEIVSAAFTENIFLSKMASVNAAGKVFLPEMPSANAAKCISDHFAVTAAFDDMVFDREMASSTFTVIVFLREIVALAGWNFFFVMSFTVAVSDGTISLTKKFSAEVDFLICPWEKIRSPSTDSILTIETVL